MLAPDVPPEHDLTNDLLGNRTWENYWQTGAKRYVYDELSRATSICASTDGAAYECVDRSKAIMFPTQSDQDSA